MSRLIEMWTDGSGNNPGDVGWAAILTRAKGSSRVVGGYAKDSTVNRAETMAVIDGLEAINIPCSVVIYTDSQYVVNGIKRLLRYSILQTNKDLWDRLEPQLDKHSISVQWTRGHNVDRMNHLADAFADFAWRNQMRIDKYIDDLEPMFARPRKSVQNIMLGI